MEINKIVEEYKNGKLTVEEANSKLQEAGAKFFFNPNNGKNGWTEEEMKEGFNKVEATKEIQRKLDLSRHVELANMVGIQFVGGIKFNVFYDELGYAVKAVKCK